LAFGLPNHYVPKLLFSEFIFNDSGPPPALCFLTLCAPRLSQTSFSSIWSFLSSTMLSTILHSPPWQCRLLSSDKSSLPPAKFGNFAPFWAKLCLRGALYRTASKWRHFALFFKRATLKGTSFPGQFSPTLASWLKAEEAGSGVWTPLPAGNPSTTTPCTR